MDQHHFETLEKALDTLHVAREEQQEIYAVVTDIPYLCLPDKGAKRGRMKGRKGEGAGGETTAADTQPPHPSPKVAAVLHLGNVCFEDTSRSDGGCGVVPGPALGEAARLLQVHEGALRERLTNRRIMVMREEIVKKLNAQEVCRNLPSLSLQPPELPQ